MRIRTFVMPLSLAVAIGVVPAHAQYKEMSKVEALSKDLNEQQMLEGLSKHLSVPADTLKQQMTSNKLNFGQLYLAHAIARVSRTDVSNILADSKSKLWTEITVERKVDKKQLATDESALEKTLKSLKGGK